MMRRVLLVLGTLLCLVAQPWPPVTPTRSAEPSHQPAPGAAALFGTVSSKQQVTLPGMATVRVELIDLSAKDPRSALVGEDAHWIVGGKLPVNFRIAYDPSRIDPAHVYVVRARVIDGDKVLLMSTAPYYVLTRGALKRPVDIVVVPEQSGIR